MDDKKYVNYRCPRCNKIVSFEFHRDDPNFNKFKSLPIMYGLNTKYHKECSDKTDIEEHLALHLISYSDEPVENNVIKSFYDEFLDRMDYVDEDEE